MKDEPAAASSAKPAAKHDAVADTDQEVKIKDEPVDASSAKHAAVADTDQEVKVKDEPVEASSGKHAAVADTDQEAMAKGGPVDALLGPATATAAAPPPAAATTAAAAAEVDQVNGSQTEEAAPNTECGAVTVTAATALNPMASTTNAVKEPVAATTQ